MALSPLHKGDREKLNARFKKLGLGHDAPENIWGKWSDTSTEKQPYRQVLGKYSHRIMSVLRTLIGFSVLRHRLLVIARNEPFHKYGLKSKERDSLIQGGWPKWIIDAACLPKFGNDTAIDWFEVGWIALRESAGGNVANIKELVPVGESRAKVWLDYGATPEQQENQRERQIHDRLLETFLVRFKLTS